LGEATRFGDALNRIACVAERPAMEGRAGVQWASLGLAMDGITISWSFRDDYMDS